MKNRTFSRKLIQNQRENGSSLKLDDGSRVIAIIQDANPMRWLQYRGTARIADSTDDRYTTIHIVPERIDLIDEDRGWGARETLDL